MQNATEPFQEESKIRSVFWGTVILGGVFLVSRNNYLLFHSIVEVFSVCIAFAVFLVVWNCRRFIQNNYLKLIGTAYLFIAILEFLHYLSYKGMGIFSGYDANLPTQLWIASRYLLAASFLIGFFFLKRTVNLTATLFIYAAVFSLIIFSLFIVPFFPDCFTSEGLTPFKIASEYIISVLFIVAIILLNRNKEFFSGTVFRWLALSMLMIIPSELAFTLYNTPYTFPNMAGHVLKSLSVYFLYRALVETGLRNPMAVLFSDLSRTEKALRESLESEKNRAVEISQLLDTTSRLNQTIRLERDRFVNILDTTQDGVYIVNQDYTIQYANPAIQKEFGQVANKRCFETFFGGAAPCKWCKLDEVLKGRIVQCEFHSPKTNKVYDSIDAPIINEDGTVSKLKIMRDITERQKMEESLRKMTGELEKRVTERTEQLRRTVEQLQEEVLEKIMAQEKIHEHRRKLQEMATELLHVEERERRHIAVQLHDSIGQLLAFSRREIGRIKKMLPDDQQESLGYVWKLIGDAVEQTRNLTFELSSPTLYTLGFEPAIEELVEQIAVQSGFEYTVDSPDEEILLAEHMQVLLYRSVRELLINIAKHAKATEVNVSLRKCNDNIEIEINDNGTGFEADMLNKDGKLAGFGLFSLRERLSTVNGEMKIVSRKGAGTKVRLSAPLLKKGDSQ